MHKHSRNKKVAWRILSLILLLMGLNGCTLYKQFSPQERNTLEGQLKQHAQTLCQPFDLFAKDAPSLSKSSSYSSSVQVVDALFRPFKLLHDRLGVLQNEKDIRRLGVPRSNRRVEGTSKKTLNQGKIGDIVVFYSHPLEKASALQVAVVTDVLGDDFYQLCGYFRSHASSIRLNLKYPHFRRHKDLLLNSYIREKKASDPESTAYLAGERFLEFRALF